MPAPATLAAYTALRQGHGAVANVALDRALHADPDYTMAQLLRAAISSGLPPALLHARLTQAPMTRLLTGTDDSHPRHRHSSHE